MLRSSFLAQASRAYHTATRVIDRIRWRWLEVRTGVVTQASIHARQLGHGDEEYGYQPIDRRSLESALRELPVQANDVFVDFGCGMGRAVLIAGMHRRPFRRVIGVEFSSELAKIARKNAQLAKRRLSCNDVEVVEANAIEYDIPEDVSVVFMFNPFGGEVLQRVLDNLRQSLHDHPRELSVIYSIPNEQDDLLARQAWLATARRIPTPHATWQKMTLYQHQPECDSNGFRPLTRELRMS